MTGLVLDAGVSVHRPGARLAHQEGAPLFAFDAVGFVFAPLDVALGLVELFSGRPFPF